MAVQHQTVMSPPPVSQRGVAGSINIKSTLKLHVESKQAAVTFFPHHIHGFSAQFSVGVHCETLNCKLTRAHTYRHQPRHLHFHRLSSTSFSFRQVPLPLTQQGSVSNSPISPYCKNQMVTRQPPCLLPSPLLDAQLKVVQLQGKKRLLPNK